MNGRAASASRADGGAPGGSVSRPASPALDWLRRMSAELVRTIHDSKVSLLAEKAHLSERERDVLRYLLLGRTCADIATILEISPRTVKFHQANLLDKLGADSRADLLRLIL